MLNKVHILELKTGWSHTQLGTVEEVESSKTIIHVNL